MMRLRITLQLGRKYLAPCLFSLLLVGCGSVPQAPSSPAPDTSPKRPVPATPNTARGTIPVLPPAGSGRGGYYQDDGPGDQIPDGLDAIPDAEPKVEPYSPRANRPYVVFGKRYTPITDERPVKQRGVGSWYGKKFHGLKTSSGEPYDMYKMTAAHPTLPIPSYVRVTNLNTGTQVIVRINDRGPFHSSRIIDLSYTAALKLGYLGKGSSMLEVERLLPDEIERILASKQNLQAPAQPLAQEAPTPASTTPSPAVPYAVNATPNIEVSPVAKPDAIQSNDTTKAMPVAAVVPPQQGNAKSPGQAISSVIDIAQASGFYLQFGAFTQASNAEAVRNTLVKKWASTLPPLEVVENGTYFRLYSGPFATHAEAANAAQQALEAGISKPMVVQR
jgi:rare lipoprotein A